MLSRAAERLDLNGIDLNLLPKFRALYRRRSVSAAARDLHVTQSALSNSLARMRIIFADELFVRTTEGMEPTAVAKALVDPVERALARLESGLSRAGSFVAENSHRTFRIATTQLAEAWIIPHILPLMEATAPYVVLEMVRMIDRGFEDGLRNGPFDFALGDLPELGPGFRDETLGAHELVCIVRKGHPILQAPLTERTLANCTFVEVVEHGAVYSNLSRAMVRMSRADAMRFKTANALALPYLIRATDLVAVVPRWFAARQAQSHEFVSVHVPQRGAVDVVRLFWHANNHDEEAHMWMRTLLTKASTFAKTEPLGAEPMTLIEEGTKEVLAPNVVDIVVA